MDWGPSAALQAGLFFEADKADRAKPMAMKGRNRHDLTRASLTVDLGGQVRAEERPVGCMDVITVQSVRKHVHPFFFS